MDWKKISLGLGVSALASLLLLLAIVLVSINKISSQPTSACTPDGKFALYPSSYSYWSLSGVLQITLAYGALDFGTAKFIDVVWDIVSSLRDAAVDSEP
jgi:hypothetical protein